MPGYATDYYAAKVLDHFNNVAAHTPQATMWLALTTVVLARTDVVMPSGVEIVGFGYARAAFPNDSTFWTAAGLDVQTAMMTSSNKGTVAFPNATSDYPPVPGWAIIDNPIGGNVHHAGAFDNQIGTAVSGQTPTVGIGAIKIPASGS